MILQTLRWRLWFISTNPTLDPATRALNFPGDLTFVPALQMQGNGLFAKRNLALHRSTSWLPYQKVYHMLLQFFALEL
jgi:hypothetical protein